MEERNEKSASLDVENDLVDQVVAGMQADIPAAMIESRIDDSVRDFEYRLSQQGLKLADYLKYMGVSMDDFRSNFKENAEKQVKMRLALEAVAAKENIVASDEEFEAKVKELADQYKMEVDQVKAVVNAEELKKDLGVNKAIDFIKEKAVITTETVGKEEEAKTETEAE